MRGIAKCAAGSVSLAGLWAMSETLYESLQGVIANRLGKEVSMEDLNDIHYEDDALDRELNALVREMEQEDVIRRAASRRAAASLRARELRDGFGPRSPFYMN